MLYIHIGAQKTGSTTIQKALHDNRALLARKGLKYVDALPEDTNKVSHYNSVRGFFSRLPEEVDHTRRFVSQIWDTRRNYLISAENLSNWPAPAVVPVAADDYVARKRKCIADIRAAFAAHEVAVVFCVRNREDYLRSLFKQYLKMNDQPTLSIEQTLHRFLDRELARSDFDREAALWREAFPDMRVIDFDAHKDGTLLEAFFRTIDQDFVPRGITDQNVSPGWAELEVQRLRVSLGADIPKAPKGERKQAFNALVQDHVSSVIRARIAAPGTPSPLVAKADPPRPRLEKLYLNAGQMKAGTSYLYTILQNHGEIFFSPEKEIHYLAQKHGPFRILSDNLRLRKARIFTSIANKADQGIEEHRAMLQWIADYLRPPTTEGWYEDMFKGRSPGQWAADFSNLTCTIPVEGLKEVARMADDVRVTYCIRDAISRAFSHAKFHLLFMDQAQDLAAMAPEDLRALLLSDNIYPQSQSEAHITALRDVFGDERLRIIRCESLWSDPRPVIDSLCGFLEIAPLPGEIEREAVNAGPKAKKTDGMMQVFEDIFGELQERHEALLERHRGIVIG